MWMNCPTRAGNRCLDEKTGAEIVRPRGDLHVETWSRQQSLRWWSRRCSLSNLRRLSQQQSLHRWSTLYSLFQLHGLC